MQTSLPIRARDIAFVVQFRMFREPFALETDQVGYKL
jgi:hypothetical protein